MNIIVSYFTQLSFHELILGAALLFFFLILLFYDLFVYRKPYKYEKRRKEISVDESDLPGISVIITSKNDAEQLKKNLPFVMEQDYPDFEVIVVNCGSSDDTDTVLNAADQEYPNFYHTFIPSEADGINEKKLAITLGVKAAKNDILLFTESFCKPRSSSWIREFGKQFTQGKDILLGYSNLVMPKKVEYSSFIRYDNLIHNLKFIASAIAGKPFMGSGSNMAYKKDVFFTNKGFSSILGIDGGEDDLFINRMANKKNTDVVISENSITETDSIDSILAWRSLKSKHLYTKQLYRGNSSLFFGIENFSKYSFLILFIASITSSIYTVNYLLLGFALILFAIKLWVRLLVINRNCKHFGIEKFNLKVLFYDLIQPISNQRFTRYANDRNRAILAVRKWYN